MEGPVEVIEQKVMAKHSNKDMLESSVDIWDIANVSSRPCTPVIIAHGQEWTCEELVEGDNSNDLQHLFSYLGGHFCLFEPCTSS